MPMRCLTSVAEIPEVKWIWPLVGFISNAAIRKRVVFPAPLGPRRATNSPDWISSETPRKATSEPKRFSTRSNEMPSCEAVVGAAKAIRSASHKIAEDLLHALALAGIVQLADCAGLTAELEAEEIVLQLVETASNFAVDVGNGRGCGFRRGGC